MNKQLTDKQIKSLKPKSSSYYITDTATRRGLGRLTIKVQKSGRKTFFFRYYKDNKRVFIQLGDYPKLKLTQANQLATEYSRQLSENIDPKDYIAEQLEIKNKHEEAKIAEQKAQALKGSIHDLFISYTDNMRDNGKRTYKAVLSALEKEALPTLGDKKASDVTVNDIKIILSGLIQRGASVQSNRIRSYLSAAFNYGIRHDNDPAYMNRPAIFGITYNPVTSVPKQNVEKVGERDLSANEIAQLWHDLDQGGFSYEVRIAIKLCFTTGGQRPNELFKTEWHEIDMERGVWELPSSKTKNKRSHIVPLTNQSIELLKELHQLTGHTKFLFPKRLNEKETMPPTSMSRAISRYCQKELVNGQENVFYSNKFVPRDIRRTVKTRMGEIGLSKEIRDRIANHALNDVSSKHYDRYDYMQEKKEALNTWCEWLANLTKEKAPSL